MKKLAKVLLITATLPLVLVLALGLGGQSVDKAIGLRMQYIPPNLKPSVEICEVVQVQAVDTDLFQVPN